VSVVLYQWSEWPSDGARLTRLAVTIQIKSDAESVVTPWTAMEEQRRMTIRGGRDLLALLHNLDSRDDRYSCCLSESCAPTSEKSGPRRSQISTVNRYLFLEIELVWLSQVAHLLWPAGKDAALTALRNWASS